MIRNHWRLGLSALALTFLTSSMASAGPIIETRCQKNIGDGRILIVDSRVLPADDSTFKVLAYRSDTANGDWTEGPCTVRVTGHAR